MFGHGNAGTRYAKGVVLGAVGHHIREVAGVNRFLNTVVSWLRAGYPTGVPETDYLPILALLSRQLTKDEVILIARELMHLPDPDFADIGAEIMRITDELPAPTDVERVREKLFAHGWPLDDPRDSEDVE